MSTALAAIAPELTLAVMALVLLLLAAVRGQAAARPVLRGGAVALALVFAVLGATAGAPAQSVFGDMVVVDVFATALKMALVLALMAALALSAAPMRLDNIARPEYPIVTLLAGVGMMGMVSAQHFLALYVAMEMQALALYILVSSGASSARSAEAGVKYVLLGALASALMLFGMALLYGATGALDYVTIRTVLEGVDAPGLTVGAGLAFLLAGMAFKISATPFHMWTPDVYAGAPTRVTTLLALAPKIAAAGALARLLFGPLEPLAAQWVPILVVLSVASMSWAALAGVVQGDLKRLMAYSTIGNMGYMLLGFIAGGADGLAAALFYLLVYVLSVAGVFAVILAMRRDGRVVTEIVELSGLARSRPLLAAGMAALMLSLAGVPPLAGFFAKFVVFKVLIDQGMWLLAVYGLLTTVVAAYYYIKVVKVLYFDIPAEPLDRAPARARAAVLAVSVLGVVALLLAPGLGLDVARVAVAPLF
ncbi:MAG TPA: NADH-quinone oxidoreductase subunit N [Rhodospirillaceae bacterium]|jgi:NADH-quinone oxidoreductase subunit N|nr:NADH-quinone oxidoreductase subunit N [Alphaproteobacteria bacterium]HBH25779.1 NADH-quinone oxidoreductase subunit N [Rhodospirillaceae bacterium]